MRTIRRLKSFLFDLVFHNMLHSLCLIPRNALYCSHQLYWESDFQYLLLFIFVSFCYWRYVSTWSWRGSTTQSLHLFLKNGKRQRQLLVSTRSTSFENRIFNRSNVKIYKSLAIQLLLTRPMMSVMNYAQTTAALFRASDLACSRLFW